MIRRFPAGVSRSLAGALVLAAALALPAASASAQDVTEFSSQAVPKDSAAPRMKGPPAGAGPRGPGVAPRFGGPGQQFSGPRGPVGPYVGGPHGPGFRGPAVGFRGPSYWGGRAAFIRGRHHVRRGGVLLPLIGLGALGAIYLGSRAYTPYAYVDGPIGPTCSGPTEDGVCELRITEVPLETGGAELQCVAYCPQ